MTAGDDARGSGARTILVLQCISEGEPEFTLKSVADKLDLAPSTVHRLLQVLASADIVERTPAQTYRIGREFFRIASLVAAKYDTGRIARPFLRKLWNEWQETCAFGAYKPATHSVLIVEVIDTPHPLQYVVEPMTDLSLVWGSLGRSILAFLPDEEFEEAYSAVSRGPLSGRPPPARGKLREELQAVKKRGFAVFEDRAFIDVAGVAAPVFDASGNISGAVGVLMPITRFDGYSLKKMGASVVEQARLLSAEFKRRTHS
jgi:DNA-binding IclR family transcriptional regulator